VRLSAWRIVRKKRLATAMTGQGASLYPGRWNGLGVPVVYAARSISLAILELLVHMESAPTTPEYRLLELEFEESLVTAVDVRRLPRNWRRDPAPRQLQTVGNRWVRRGQSAVLQVPSAITGEPNYLLNPAHPDFGKISVGRPTVFKLDARLVS
jgi:RES domain-containing protein